MKTVEEIEAIIRSVEEDGSIDQGNNRTWVNALKWVLS